jgi:PAS domain S-box-containing protein
MSKQSKPAQETHASVLPPNNGFAVTEAAEWKQADARLRQQFEQLRRHNEALHRLTAQDATTVDLNERLEQITQIIGQTLDVERVGIWLYDQNKTKIECIKLYEHSPDRYNNGGELAAVDFPAYFQALEEEYIIDAHDALTDPRTAEFADSYLKPLNIASMLDLPIQRGKVVSGVICIEHVGSPRTWHEEEINFAVSTANQVALALERDRRVRAEMELQASQQAISTLMTHLPGMVYRCRNDRDWTMEFVSSGAASLTGYQPGDLVDNRTLAFADLIHPEDRTMVWQTVQDSVEEKRPFTVTYRLRTGDEQEKWVWEQGRGIFDTDGQLLRLEGFITDITDQERANLALAQSEQRFRILAENLPGVIYLCHNDERYTMAFINDQVEALTGYSAQAFLDDEVSFVELYHPDDVPAIEEEVEAALAAREAFYLQYRIKHRLGDWRWVEETGAGIYSDSGELLFLEGILNDITYRQDREQELEKRLRYERSLSLASQALISADETAVTDTLEYLRDAAHACRAYYFEIFEDRELGTCGKQLFEACAPDVSSQLDDPDLQRFPFAAAGFKRWLEMLSRGNPINNIFSEMPSSEQDILAPQEIQSILVLPVIINGEWRGMVGFDDTKQATRWQEADIQLLQTAAGMIGAYIERQQANQMLQTRLGYEHGLSLASQSLLTATTDDALTEALHYLRTATNTSRAYFFENFVDEELGLCHRQLYEACAPGVEPQIDSPELQRMPYESSGLGRWAEVLATGQVINAVAANLPAPEDEIVASFGIEAILLLPVFVQDRWHGYIGFDRVDVASAWPDEDAQLLMTAARLFGAYLERTQLYGEIEGSLQKREAQVRVSTLVAREIAGMPDLSQLYERIVTLIKEEFGYYHVQLLRYDPALDNVGLVVGYGEIGARMLAMNHSMPMGVGVIGKAAAEGRSVLLEDVRQDSNWKPNSLLPGTRSELAVPIKVGDEVLGVIDVQSEQLAGLTPADQLLLDGLCGQLAIAIESTRLRQDMEDRLREVDSLQRFMSRSGWETYQERQQSTPGYLFQRGDIQPLADLSSDLLPSQVPMALRRKSETAVTSQASSDNGQQPAAARVHPLAVRGVTIGNLVVEADEERPLTPEEEAFLQSVSEQVAEALEAARLFEQTQTALAEQERLSSELATVAQVSTAASTILEAEALLQAAVDLAQTSFNLSHAHIYLYDRNKQLLELRAGAGDAGRLITLEGRAIGLNADSLVARAARDRQGALSNNVQKTLEFVPHPMLASTRSELAIPMIVGGSLIGVLDLLSDETDRFSEQDLGIFNTLASQVAVAVQNAQLYAEQVATAEDLRKVDLLKSEFLASMSHELRTPLNSIIGFADVLLEGIDGELNERMEEDVRLIRESGSHLRALIGDILDMSKIEAGMMEIRQGTIDMNQLAEDVVATAMPLAQEKDLYLRLKVEDDAPTIYADHTRIRQVLWNIVGNAIKFTQEGGITVTVGQSENNDLLVSVADTGVGIRQSDMGVVFEQFRQVGGELNTSSSGGTGLGLPISKKLIELHGGEIWVESAVGEGSTFYFTLPVGLPSAGTTKPKTGPLPVLS